MSQNRPVIAGFCANLAEEFGLAPSIVRLVALVFAFMPTGLTYMTCAWLSERHTIRAAPYRGLAGAPPAASHLAPVVQRLRALDSRLAGMEAFVASKDFELHRGFRNIGR
jgi:phage shock protein C